MQQQHVSHKLHPCCNLMHCQGERAQVVPFLQAALACFEGKKKLLEQSKLLRNAFVVTAQAPLPDDLVTAVQVTASHISYALGRYRRSTTACALC